MKVQESKYLDFSNQHIFVGIDVHFKQWHITILTEYNEHRSFSGPPSADSLIHYLKKNFTNAAYHCVYEAGFSGFGTYERLKELGADCIVINPADVPTTNKEKDRKTDRIDSRKLAHALRNDQLIPIHVHSRRAYEDRCLIRGRNIFVKNQTRCKNQIKSHLKFFNIELDDNSIKTHWSNKYIEWLLNIDSVTSGGKQSLNLMIEELRAYRSLIYKTTKQITKLSETDQYSENVKILRTVPGISTLSAMTILTELGDINRFSRLDKLLSYIGLIPSEHSSGEKEIKMHMTNRGNSLLKKIIVEASWIAVRKDPGLSLIYGKLKRSKGACRAIIVIAKKLTSRIMFVLKNHQEYKFLPAA